MRKINTSFLEDRNLIIDSYVNGESVYSLCKKYRVSKETFKKYLIEWGVDIRSLRGPKPSKGKYDFPEIGEIFGQWTVISTKTKITKRNRFWEVQCKCGDIFWRSAYTLCNGKVTSCKSCCKATNNLPNFINAYYNKLTNRIKLKKFESNITPEILYEMFLQQNRKCALSGIDIDFKKGNDVKRGLQTASLDRIDSSKGYIVGNVQWVHKDINFMKGTLSNNQFLELCNLVSKHNK